MKEYHKIETLYNRSETGTKELVMGSFRDESVEFLKDNLWIFTEKVDGTNIRVYWDGHSVTFGGRTDAAQIPAHLFKYLQDTFLSDEAEQMFEQKFGETEVILFGEGYGSKIQAGGGDYRSDVGFILFDVYIGMYLKRDGVEDIAKAFGIPIVPIVFGGTLDEAVEYVKRHPKSRISEKEKYMEGIVGTPAIPLLSRNGRRIIVKIKYGDFK